MPNEKRTALNAAILEYEFQQAKCPFGRNQHIDRLIEAAKAFQQVIQGEQRDQAIRRWLREEFNPEP